jgi:hypothetical protein
MLPLAPRAWLYPALGLVRRFVLPRLPARGDRSPELAARVTSSADLGRVGRPSGSDLPVDLESKAETAEHFPRDRSLEAPEGNPRFSDSTGPLARISRACAPSPWRRSGGCAPSCCGFVGQIHGGGCLTTFEAVVRPHGHRRRLIGLARHRADSAGAVGRRVCIPLRWQPDSPLARRGAGRPDRPTLEGARFVTRGAPGALARPHSLVR